MPRKIPVTVAEDTPELIRRGAVPSPESVVTKTVELSTDVLRNEMGERLQDLDEDFSESLTKLAISSRARCRSASPYRALEKYHCFRR